MTEAKVVPLHKPDERLAEERAAAARIVQGILENDEAAGVELVGRYSKGLRFLLNRLCGDDERARDLLQETFLVVVKNIRDGKLGRPERLAGYLKGVAQKVAMGAGRKRAREPLAMETEMIAAVADEQPRQIDQFSSEQTRAAVREMLDEITVERDRELLMRFYIYDQDKPQICQALDFTSRDFNRVLHRARGRFRKILVESGYGPDGPVDESS